MAWQKLLLPSDVLQIRKNSGTYNTARQKLNFIEGTNIVLSVNDDGSEIDTTISVDSDVQDAVAKKHTQNTDTELDNGVIDIDSNDNITFNQNGVTPFTSVNENAVTNTLYLKEGKVCIGATTQSGKLSIMNLGSSDTVKCLVISEDTNDEFYIEGGFSGAGADGNKLKLKTYWGNYPMTWVGNGNVGIKTTNPDVALDVSGVIKGTDLELTNGTIYPSTDSTTAIQINKADSTTNVIDIDTTNGRMGIETDSPDYPLTVNITGGFGIMLQDEGSDRVGLYTSNTDTRGLIYMYNGTGTLTNLFDTNGDSYIKGGKFGIGTVPSKTLHLSSTEDVGVWLEADTDNSGEDDNPYIKLTQDNNLTRSIIGMIGTAGYDPEGNSYTGTTANALFLGTQTSNIVQIGTNGSVRLTIDTSGYITPSVGYKSSDGTAGMNTTYTVKEGDTITIKDGLITAISSG